MKYKDPQAAQLGVLFMSCYIFKKLTMNIIYTRIKGMVQQRNAPPDLMISEKSTSIT